MNCGGRTRTFSTCFRDRQPARLADSAKAVCAYKVGRHLESWSALIARSKSARDGSNILPLGYQPSALPAVSYAPRVLAVATLIPVASREVDPAGLEPAHHSLKGCRTAARALGHRGETVAEGVEPTMAALTERCLTSLATPHRNEVAGTGIEPAFIEAAYETAVPTRARPRTSRRGCGGGIRTRTHLFTRQALWFQFELRRKDGPEGICTLTRSLQDFYAAVTSPALEVVMSDE
jgi:hypothetical protein